MTVVRRALRGLLVAAIVGACGSGASGVRPPTEAEVLAAYRAYRDEYLAAADPLNAGRLPQFATGRRLEHLERAWRGYLERGEVVRGHFELAPTVLTVEPTRAVVADCYADLTAVYDAATGAPRTTPSSDRFEVIVTMALVDDRWKVSDEVHLVGVPPRPGGCDPATPRR